jgi:Tetratricopeptide repeat.
MDLSSFIPFSSLVLGLVKLLLAIVSIRFDTRLYCVALLDGNQALTLIRQELKSFAETAPLADANLVFWTLWESAARTRSANDKAIVLAAALMIDARIPLREAAGEADFALEGILCSVTGRAARKLNLSPDAVPAHHMTTTAKAACQIVAAAHLHDAGRSREILLERLVERFLLPARRWQETSAVHRRAALAVVTGAVRHLYEHGCASDLLRAVGTHFFSSADQLLWDWYPGEFLQLIILTLGSASAARILKLHSSRWRQNLEAGHVTFDSLQLLWAGFFLSESHPESKNKVRPLLQKLVDVGFESFKPYLSCTLVLAKAAGLRIEGEGKTARSPVGHVSVRNPLAHALNQLAAHGTVSRSVETALKEQLTSEEMTFFRSRFLRKRQRPLTRAADRATQGGPAPQRGPEVPNLSSHSPSIAWNAYANEHYKAGRYEEAIQAARKAREINPNDRDARRTLAFALNQLGRVEEAAAVERESHPAGSTDEDFERAATAARKDLEARPDSAGAWRRLANALNQLNRPGEVISLATTRLKERPNIHPAIWGVCEVLLNRRTAAIASLLEELVRLDDPNARYWNLLGAARRKGGNPKGALDAGLRAVELTPGVGQYWYSLGRTYEELKDIDNAIATHRRAITFKHKKAAVRLKSLLRRSRPEASAPEAQPR